MPFISFPSTKKQSVVTNYSNYTACFSLDFRFKYFRCFWRYGNNFLNKIQYRGCRNMTVMVFFVSGDFIFFNGMNQCSSIFSMKGMLTYAVKSKIIWIFWSYKDYSVCIKDNLYQRTTVLTYSKVQLIFFEIFTEASNLLAMHLQPRHCI